MNTLIIGGLLGLAVLAILGAVLLGIGEDRAEKAQQASLADNATALLPQQSQSRQMTGQLAATPEIPRTPLLARSTGQLPRLEEDESFAGLNGQVREITSELRILAQRAGELEQRLSDLSELLERQQAPRPATSGQLYAPETDPQAL